MNRTFNVEVCVGGNVSISIRHGGAISNIARLNLEEFLELLQAMSNIRDSAIISKDQYALDMIRSHQTKVDAHKAAIKEVEEKIEIAHKEREEFFKKMEQYAVKGDSIS